jgi:hypothetical protein
MTIHPEGNYYLASHYQDKRRGFETWRVYYDDGRVEAYDGQAWWTVCRFSESQIDQAKAAIQASGLLSASDLTAANIHDTASLTYTWRWAGQSGSVTNWAYPARTHPVFETLEAQLDSLEAEASGRIAN